MRHNQWYMEDASDVHRLLQQIMLQVNHTEMPTKRPVKSVARISVGKRMDPRRAARRVLRLICYFFELVNLSIYFRFHSLVPCELWWPVCRSLLSHGAGTSGTSLALWRGQFGSPCRRSGRKGSCWPHAGSSGDHPH